VNEQPASAPPSLPNTVRCLKCGYALRDLPADRCPECGRPFDPADRRTFAVGSLPLLRFFARPPKKWHVLMTIAITIYLLLGRATPMGAMGLFIPLSCCVMIFLPLLLLSYGLRLVATLKIRYPAAQPGNAATPARFRWYSLPACALLVASTSLYNWPLAICFAVSRPAFEREVARLTDQSASAPRTQRNTNHRHRWIGLYYVLGAYPGLDADGLLSVRFPTGQPLISLDSGFIYDAARASDRSVKELPPGWSMWREVDD
jgi:hypothetical protein